MGGSAADLTGIADLQLGVIGIFKEADNLSLHGL